MPTFISACSGLSFPESERISGQLVRKPILELIQQNFSGFGAADSLAASELNEYCRRYLENFLVREVGELTELEETVLSNVLQTNAHPLTRPQLRRFLGYECAIEALPHTDATDESHTAGCFRSFRSRYASARFASNPGHKKWVTNFTLSG